MIKDFTCKLRTVKPIVEWVEEEDNSSCHPCLIAPLASFYMGILKNSGELKLATRLKEIYEESGDILTISQELDKIKSEVGEAIRQELRDLDCYAQSFKSQDDAE